jgi:hypothetical protein
LATPDDRVWLKMDVQGYEGRVLDGAQVSLARCLVVELELSLWAFYEGQPDFFTMILRLKEQGFDLWSVSPGSRTQQGQMVEMDGIFVNRRLAAAAKAQQ